MDRTRLARTAAPVAVFVAVLGTLVVATHQRHQPRPLRALPLAAAGRTAAERGTVAKDAVAPGVPPYGAFPATDAHIADALLTGLPAEGPVFTLGAATDRVAALAAALGVAGEVRTTAEEWSVGTGERALHVVRNAGLPWYVGPDKVAVGSGGAVTGVAPAGVASVGPGSPAPPPAPDDPVTSGPNSSGPGDAPNADPVPPPIPCPTPLDGKEIACTLPYPATPPPLPPQPSDTEARAAAKPVLDAIGLLADAVVTLEPGYAGKDVVATPVVGGLATFGCETRLTIDAHGTIVWANGLLAKPAFDATYPLLDPRAAVARGGVTYARDLAVGAPIAVSASPAPPREVTKVRLGLMFRPSYDAADEAFLVPAWLLSYADTTFDEPVLALPDQYVATPPPPSGGEVPPSKP